jgi:CheY-like chemotaxis protein
VLDITRIEAGGLSMSLEPVSVSDVMHGAIELADPLAGRHEVLIVYADPAPSDVYVLADNQRLKQVLINLIVNGVKYNYPGGLVRVGVSTGGDGVRIEVTDSGPGIDEESLTRMFTPFERLGADSRGIEGSGLGLALSRSLIANMGGEIGVSSRVGSGSSFWIDLPLADPLTDSTPADRGRADTLASRPYASPFRVLYIEDTVTNVRFVEAVLRRRPSIELLPAMMGRLGLELAREHRPDLILLDLHLPDLSGEDVLAELREGPETREIPVVILSADATEATRVPLRDAGARDFMTKPIGVQPLLELVDRIASETP